jgi:hypothetical protein
MSDSSPTRIVIFAAPDDPADLREVLQRELGLNQVDAGIAAHYAPGILPRSWPRALAEKAAAAIQAVGLRAVAIDAAAAPDLAHAERVHHLRCTAQGLEVCNLSGTVERTRPWNELSLVSVGRVPLEHQRHYVTDNLTHLNPVPPDEYLRGGAIRGLEAWLLFADGLRPLRCDSEHMNYEYLGDRKTGSGAANFERLIADIAVAAPHALLTPTTRKYLTHSPLLEYDFKDSATLQEQTIVQWLLARELRGG